MNGMAEQITFLGLGATLAMMALGLVSALVIPGIDRWNRRFFAAFFTVFLMSRIVYTVDVILYGMPGLESVEKAVWFLQSLLGSIPMPMFTFYLVHCYGEDWRRSVLFRTVIAIWGLYVLLLCIGQLTPLFNVAINWESRLRQDLRYPSGAIALIGITLLNLISVIRRWNALPPKKRFAFLAMLLPVPVIFVYLVFSASGLLFTDIGISLSTLSMFFIILHDQAEQNMRQQQEIAHQRSSIMILQMRPHFIYNTMMSIYYLCKQDPDLAQQVTLDFTTYLRRNFTALASEEPIPFSEELEHTRTYLAVEQAQFDDMLFIDYDTPHVDFRLPPLTLQPIAENAVKHGMNPDSAPLRIRITTRRTGSGSEIIVEDNGPGFDPEDGFKPTDDSEPHVALKNIRERLEIMCNGKMTIVPREGGGTLVRVTIP